MLLASNCEILKVVSKPQQLEEELEDSSQADECQMLTGHTEIVLSVDVWNEGELLLSGSKDGTARLWKRQGSQYTCAAVFRGQTAGITSVALEPKRASFFVSASQSSSSK